MIRAILTFTFLIILQASCRDESIKIPTRPNDMGTNRYHRYVNNYKRAVEENDKYEMALALANLRADEDLVYSKLRESIRDDNSVCYELYEFQRLHEEHDFNVVLLTYNNEKWSKIVHECRSQVTDSLFQIYQSRRLAKYKERRSKTKIDSSKLELQLIEKLDTILYRDQLYRGHNTVDWDRQDRLDSINLITVDSILRRYRYPSYESIGLDHINTIWLVLHHQVSIDTRMKYRPFLVEAVELNRLNKNLLMNFDNRTSDLNN